MQMNHVRQRRKLELRGELGRRGHSVNSSAWMIGELEIEEDCIADLLRQKADLYIDAHRRIGLAIGPDVLKDIAHSQVEITAARKSSLAGEAQLFAMRTNRPQNLAGYGHLGKKASIAIKEIEASIDLFNLSHPETAATDSRTNDGGERDLSKQKSPARPAAPEHPYSQDGNLGNRGEFEKRSTPATSDSPPPETIWAKMSAWGVVGTFVGLILAGWMTLMTSKHPRAADGFALVGTAIFLVKFLTWEEAKKQPQKRKWLLQSALTILSFIFAFLAIRWDHTMNSAAATESPGQSISGNAQSSGGKSLDNGGQDVPVAASKGGERDETAESGVTQPVGNGAISSTGRQAPPVAEAAHPEPLIQDTYQRVFSDDFLFELQSCVLRGGNLTCDFTVTNDLGSDRTLGLLIYWGPCSRIFDGEGNEYISKSGQLGNESGTPGISGIGDTLIPGVKTKAALEFEGIPPKVKLIQLLRVVFDSPDGRMNHLSADFHDVPVQAR